VTDVHTRSPLLIGTMCVYPMLFSHVHRGAFDVCLDGNLKKSMSNVGSGYVWSSFCHVSLSSFFTSSRACIC
jgi:hypothetical protein